MKKIDELVWQAVFGDIEEKKESASKIRKIAEEKGIHLSSTQDLYSARGRGEVPANFTVPAINMRGMAYDMAVAIFTAAKKLDVGALIFEIARSEIGYTGQTPREYASVVLAGAIKTGWRGPVFIQGDHFQIKTDAEGNPKPGEVENLKKLIADSLQAGFYNIDIDTSTLVDLDKETEAEQQVRNIEYSLEFAKYIRQQELGVFVSLGGEIGHIGGVNSTVEDFRAYMDGFNYKLPEGMVGLSKISVQTGTCHGGVVLPDGSLADVKLDFSILSEISKIGREEYGIGGAVQHGASTLPDEFFSQFPKTGAVEIHLATDFQNIILDHDRFPKKLLKEMYDWLDIEKKGKRSEGETNEQFYYKNRKRAWAEFKKDFWEIEDEIRSEIRKTIQKRCEFIFQELNVVKTKNLVQKWT